MRFTVFKHLYGPVCVPPPLTTETLPNTQRRLNGLGSRLFFVPERVGVEGWLESMETQRGAVCCRTVGRGALGMQRRPRSVGLRL